ncbi:alpha-L-rhamnosidase N-terminal domain-containing protein [Actinoplanes sp. NPDC000266]
MAAGMLAAGLLSAPAAAHGGHAPGAPIRLTVDDLAQPMNVEGTPLFGWLPVDRDAGERQTAYQIRVADRRGVPVWDSGRVRTSEQSHVAYRGAALTPGSPYTWTVRTWDGTGRPSPWAAGKTFETGLGDQDWGGAQWIQRAPGGTGPIAVTDGRARVTGGLVTLAGTGAEWTDYTLDLTVRPRTGGAGWVFRSPDRANGYMWQLVPGSGLNTHVQIGGAFTKLATVPLMVTAGTDYRVRMDIAGGTFRTFVDGVLVDERTDTRFPRGTVGFREAANEAGEFDDVAVTRDGATLFSDDFSDGTGKWAFTSARQADEWSLLRTEAALRGQRVVRARAYVAGDHTWELYLNGRRADRGSSFGYPGEGFYQASDVTRLIRGKTLAVGALLHWYGGGQGRAAGVPGLLVKIVIEYAGGGTQTIVSDGGWRAHEGPYREGALRNGEGDRIEHADATRAAAVEGWQRPGYDDAAWAPAVVLGAHPVAPFTHLTGLDARVTEETVTPVRMLTAADGTPVADFGVVIPARPIVRFDAGVHERTLTLRTSYELASNGRVATSGRATQSTDMSFPYTQTDGPQTFQAFTHLGFRYLDIPGAGEEITAADVRAVVVHTAVEGPRASFTSDDPTLNAVWQLVQRSALYSVQEQFVDTPTREKGQFLADAANISYATMQGFGERAATRKAIREFLASNRRYWTTGADAGRYNAVYPNGDGKRDIPDFTEMFVDWVWRWYEVTGDESLLAEAYPAIRETAGYVRRHIPADGPTAGLVTNLTGGSGAYRYGIVDWPEPGRFGYDMSASARTVVNALGVQVLRRAADMAAVLGEPELTSFRTAQEDLAAAMNQKLRRSDGVYVDGLLADGTQSPHAGQHSTSYAIAFGVAPQADLPALAGHLAAQGMKQGPMTAHVLLRALAEAGRPDAVLALLTNHDDLGWARILDQGGTFTWEAWDPAPGDYSQSHGWGSQAAVDIAETMLGIRIGAPGASSVVLAPPATGLGRASGSVPTQRGEVGLSWQRTSRGLRAEATVPVNVTARVELPAGVAYRVEGRARYLGTANGVTAYEIGSGRTGFVPAGVVPPGFVPPGFVPPRG